MRISKAPSGVEREGVGALLDGDGRRHSIRGALEHGQPAVAEALDQGALMAAYGVRNEAVMVSPEHVGPFLAEAHTELGRGNQIGHEDCCRRSLCHHLTVSSSTAVSKLPLRMASSHR